MRFATSPRKVPTDQGLEELPMQNASAMIPGGNMSDVALVARLESIPNA